MFDYAVCVYAVIVFWPGNWVF